MFIPILVICSVVYAILILGFIIGFEKYNQTEYYNVKPQENFSIIVPFRNEECNLLALLKSIEKLNYPLSKFEIIFIDDDSQDNSKKIIEDWKSEKKDIETIVLNNVRHTNSPKKDALTLAILKAKFDWVVTTDADCLLPKNWLRIFNQTIIKKKPYFIAGPVKFKIDSSFLYQFQNFNFLALIGTTIGAFGLKKPFLCNGANLCYLKKIFNEVNGFKQNSKIASGDDVFLLEKIYRKHPEKVIYLKNKEAIVETKSETNLASFIQQQLRWASKTTAYTNWFSKSVGLLVFIQNLILIISFLFLFFDILNVQYFVVIFILKFVVDYFLIKKTALFLNLKIQFINYFFSSLIYPAFVVFIGILPLLKNYNWKGRSYKS